MTPGWLPRPGDLYNIEGIGTILVTGVKDGDTGGWNPHRDKPYGRKWNMSYLGPYGPAEMELDRGSYFTLRYMGSAL